jgi:hypothetical protein
MALLDDLASYLQTAGVGTVGSSIFKGLLPLDDPYTPVPDLVVALIETPGFAPFHVHDAAAPDFEQPTVQVLARGEPLDYAGARAKAQEAFVALDGLHNQTLGSTTYLWVTAMQSPFYLHSDELLRPIIAFNLRCAKAL